MTSVSTSDCRSHGHRGGDKTRRNLAYDRVAAVIPNAAPQELATKLGDDSRRCKAGDGAATPVRSASFWEAACEAAIGMVVARQVAEARATSIGQSDQRRT